MPRLTPKIEKAEQVLEAMEDIGRKENCRNGDGEVLQSRDIGSAIVNEAMEREAGLGADGFGLTSYATAGSTWVMLCGLRSQEQSLPGAAISVGRYSMEEKPAAGAVRI